MADDLTAQILRDYPSFAFLLHDPEIGPLLLAAVDPNVGFDSATFQAKLMQTNWWKTTAASRRQWITLVATDPATAQNRLGLWKAQAQQAAARMGVNLSGERLNIWADELGGAQGMSVEDPRFVNALVDLHRQGFITGDSGAVEDITGQAHQLADQYMIDLTDADYAWWSDKIAKGENTLNGLQDELKQLAMDRYEAYASRIAAGVTPAQIFSLHRNTIAQEMEVDPSTIDLLHDPRWSKVIGVPMADGKVRPMTQNETIQLARSQDEWKQTRNGQALSAQLTSKLLKTFGEVNV